MCCFNGCFPQAGGHLIWQRFQLLHGCSQSLCLLPASILRIAKKGRKNNNVLTLALLSKNKNCLPKTRPKGQSGWWKKLQRSEWCHRPKANEKESWRCPRVIKSPHRRGGHTVICEPRVALSDGMYGLYLGSCQNNLSTMWKTGTYHFFIFHSYMWKSCIWLMMNHIWPFLLLLMLWGSEKSCESRTLEHYNLWLRGSVKFAHLSGTRGKIQTQTPPPLPSRLRRITAMLLSQRSLCSLDYCASNYNLEDFPFLLFLCYCCTLPCVQPPPDF